LLVELLTIHAWFTSNKLGRIVSKENRWDELHERWKEKSNLNQTSTSLRDHEGTISTHLPWKEDDLVERR
jgi:hypothetical protein